ncbi:hypothetical protein ACVMB0_000048 [Bradyrhizobium sp. USDA 4451]
MRVLLSYLRGLGECCDTREQRKKGDGYRFAHLGYRGQP